MGQGSQSGIEGQHPAWGQMAQTGGQVLPDPMQRAREHFLNARDNFLPARQEFLAMQGADRAAARPEFLQDRNEYGQIRDWYRDLQGVTDAEARGTAAFGPPRPWQPPQTMPMMQVPQIPGIEHDGTVEGLLSVLQKQTASQTFGGGDGGGGSVNNNPENGGGLTEEQIRRQGQRQRLDVAGRGR